MSFQGLYAVRCRNLKLRVGCASFAVMTMLSCFEVDIPNASSPKHIVGIGVSTARAG